MTVALYCHSFYQFVEHFVNIYHLLKSLCLVVPAHSPALVRVSQCLYLLRNVFSFLVFQISWLFFNLNSHLGSRKLVIFVNYSSFSCVKLGARLFPAFCYLSGILIFRYSLFSKAGSMPQTLKPLMVGIKMGVKMG